MMKKVIGALLCFAICLCVCACGQPMNYKEAREEFLSANSFTLSSAATMHAVMADGSDDVNMDTHATLTLYDGIYRVDIDGNTYYYYDGKTYADTADGQYSWTAAFDEFLGQFDFARPILISDAQSEGEVILDGGDYADLLINASPNLSWADPDEAQFGDFLFSYTCDNKGLRSYSLTYDVTVYNEGEMYADVHLVIKVDISEKTDAFKQPEFDKYSDTDINLGIDDDEFAEQMLYVIFEALYDEEGNKRDDFDDRYAEFVEMYGEERMQQIVEVADMFR